MSVTGKLTTRGFDEYLERIAEAGRSVDDAAARAIVAGCNVALQGMESRVAVDTGNLREHLGIDGLHKDGNYVFAKVGVLDQGDGKTAIYANVQEYGSSSVAAHPFVRPTFDEDKAKIRAAMRQSLEEDGTL